MEPNLNFVETIAREAGDILLSFIGKDLDVQHKSPTDLVTKADHAAEKFLIGAIREVFPTHAINAEESGNWEGQPVHQWYIDPLDGTKNYAHGVPVYAVSVAYAFEGQMQLGAVYDPNQGEMFSAEAGQGARLNGKSISVSGFENLIDCLLVTGFPNEMAEAPDDNTRNFIRFGHLSQGVRRLGSAALDMVYVAAGRLDGFWELELFQWDVAAGGLIVREAGGVLTDVFGDPDFLREPVSILCANAAIHEKMLAVLDAVRTESAGD
jgi:myo-inositol-1(or 4)-monophosphatase